MNELRARSKEKPLTPAIPPRSQKPLEESQENREQTAEELVSLSALVGSRELDLQDERVLGPRRPDDLRRLDLMPPGEWGVVVFTQRGKPVAGGTVVVEAGVFEQVVDLELKPPREVGKSAAPDANASPPNRQPPSP